ncbi:hypothetical protein CEG14_23945 [Bordetella genomosp. 1]|uniref:Uncharacterized protein n=1 Tax=Bordetella genomosp. 1 TaxID=1395607 RepID=A0A261RV83_9BORD|nr:hypothetical protein [Bordetella genomosp. 1]OZI28978.1 hypothetical protein CEG14_23945 [Bordetella genomosp. 1]
MAADSPKKAKRVPAAKAQQARFVRIMTPAERIRDMRAFAREHASTRESALALLRAAGIITASGKLAKPFRN